MIFNDINIGKTVYIQPLIEELFWCEFLKIHRETVHIWIALYVKFLQSIIHQ